MLIAWLIYILDEWMAFVLSARSPMINLETSKKKGFYSLLQYSKDKQNHATLNFCERRLKLVRNR